MPLFQNEQLVLESCIYDISTSIKSVITENSDDDDVSERVRIARHISDSMRHIKRGGDPLEFARRLNGFNVYSTDITWLEKQQLKIEEKLKFYDKKAKSKSNGVFARIWANIKLFLTKVLRWIVKSINTVHRFVKDKYRNIKAAVDVRIRNKSF
jgi:hypothetical protein